MELQEKPTMKVYERFSALKEKQGKLNINNLTRDNLYTMYVIQEKQIYEIAKLFDVDEEFISKTRKNFGIRMLDSIWYKDIGEMISKAYSQNIDISYEVLKQTGILNFEKHLYDILNYMRDGEKYLLKEFWKFTVGERTGIELHKAKTAKDVYFRAYLCAELLKQNNLIEEVDYLTYKITSEGKNLLKRTLIIANQDINLEKICRITGEANFYALSLIRMQNGEILYCANSDELDKYDIEEYEETEELELFEDIEEEIQSIEPKGLEEISFDKVPAKAKRKQDKKQRNSVKKDYEKVNNAKEIIREKSERLVYNMERQKLIEDNREDLLDQVIWESEEHGDGAGYDIQSLEKRNGEYVVIYIEVKGTNKSINEPFEISANEVKKSNECGDRYYIYRIGNIHSETPKYYKINGKIEENFELEATNYKASKK